MVTRDLAEYRRKRDFKKTPEPDGSSRFPAAGPLRFVVQKHKATALHYDLRLEAGGVLKSFAVPKGPHTDPSVKRMAQQTEDHPLDYLDFEGSIPRGEYGAGHMIVWDVGTYSPDEKGDYDWIDREEAGRRIEEEIAAGKVAFTTRGTRMRGSWTLVQTKNGWLLIKHKDAAATGEDLPERFDTSVHSGLSIADLAAGSVPQRAVFPASPADVQGVKESSLPAPFAPMLATTSPTRALDEDLWAFEPKLDGIRCLAFINDGNVKLYTRNLNDVTAAYPLIGRALAEQPLHDCIFDGEIAALDERGRPSFELLQQRMNLSDANQVAKADGKIPVIFFAFDLLHLDGFDLRAAAIEDRRALLSQVLMPGACVSRIDTIDTDFGTAFEASVQLGFEGVVAKRRGSQYRPGRRSDSWLKLKNRETREFVVGGFTVGEGGRNNTFGGLLLGTPRDDGLLDFCGRVGSGFNDRLLASLKSQLDQLVVKESPFAGDVPDAKKTTFVRPELVAEVEYAEITSAGILRAPVFHGIRTDKEAADLRVGGEEMVALPADDLARDIDAVLEQLESKKQKFDLQAGTYSLGVTNLDKELWPAFGGRPAHTKRDYLRYLATVAQTLLPHLRDRPLTLTRFPDGITGNSFYQRHWEAKDMPPFVEHIILFSETNAGDRPFLLCNNLATLLWLGQLADIELHASLARVNPAPDARRLSTDFTKNKENVEASVLNYPDHVLFDLDPYIYAGTEKKGEEPQFNRIAFDATCDVALMVREVLKGLGLSAFLKTSGATGLHLYVPIVRNLRYDEVRALATTVAQEVLSRAPKKVTLEWATDRRTGKIFIDVNQNARIKSLACQYSPRAKSGAPVSMPLRWDELGKRYPDEFTLETAPARLKEAGDLWGHILDSKVDLVKTLGL